MSATSIKSIFYMGHVRLNSCIGFFVSYYFHSLIEIGAERKRKGIKPANVLVERDTPAPICNCIIIDKTRTSKSTHTYTCSLNDNPIHYQLNVKYTRIRLPPAILFGGDGLSKWSIDQIWALNVCIQNRNTIENAKQSDRNNDRDRAIRIKTMPQ